MSSFLYRLGRLAFRHRVRVLLIWLGVLLVTGLAALGLGRTFDNTFSLPGTSSQQALDQLDRTFPQVSGTSAQVVFVAPVGRSVRDRAERRAIAAAVASYGRIDQVDAVASPFDQHVTGAIAPQGRAALIAVQLSARRGDISTATTDRISAVTHRLQQAVPGSRASAGGEAYAMNGVAISITEVIGVVVALVVLLLTLGSFVAAGMPLLNAILGVIITMAGIFAATGLAKVNSSTPMLALMLGLAVGIDYALFILSRHRDQLRDGMDAEESAARAVATAGSAVVFAGLTVMIALAGLAVAGIPFLTTMGMAAAIGVAVAVTIALTLLPAMVGFAGERLRPKPRRTRAHRALSLSKGVDPTSGESQPRTSGALRQAQDAEGAAQGAGGAAQSAKGGAATRRSLGGGFFGGWVRLATRWPVVTILVIVGGLGALALPARGLELALPDNGTAPAGSPARVTYDLISRYYGPGYNSPLIVTADIVTSNDPLGVMKDLKSEISRLPGVADVPLATPNRGADTGIVQVVPSSPGDSQATKDLVQRIRDLGPRFQAEHGTPIAVTGSTAIQIDVSSQLGGALLPFGILVVGLSLILLTMVFRSIAVPLKATIGYLLSVGASFGVVSLVFQHGFLAGPLNVDRQGPVLSFLPIILMGILFGLAMDYEVFLVSRIREDYVHNGNARAAIHTGFVSSARVVTAAAVIMFSVFAAFIPEGDATIKAISVGLATGVFVDAFVVRMTLVPAVLALLGDSAWRLPAVIARRLPSFDVEGADLARLIALRDWPAPDSRQLVSAEGITVRTRRSGRPELVLDRTDVAVEPGQLLVIDGDTAAARSAVLWVVSGRMRPSTGTVKTLGLVIPQQAGLVRRRTDLVDLAVSEDAAAALTAARDGRSRLVLVDHTERLQDPRDWAALADLITTCTDADRAVLVTTEDPAGLESLLPASYLRLALAPVDRREPVGVLA